jgi:hypothetical protein
MTSSFAVTLSPKGLSNIAAVAADDFTFLVNGERYCCPRPLAQYISPEVARMHAADESCETFEITNCAPAGSFGHILKLMTGDSVTFGLGEAYSMLLHSEALGNLELNQAVRGLLPSRLTLKNAVILLQHKHHAGLDTSDEVDFVAGNFAQFERRELSRLTPSLLQAVLESPSLKIETESDLFRFIEAVVAESGKEYQILYESLLFEYLCEEDLSAFVEDVTFEDLSASMWTAVRKRLVQKVHMGVPEVVVDRYSKGTIAFKGDPFCGIAAHFRKQTGENPVKEGLIEVSYQSGNPYSDKLFEKDWKCYWSSANAPGQWIAFNFPQHSVVVTDYTLKSPNSKQGWNHMKSWVVEGSVDGVEWFEIDKREGNEDLNGKSCVKTWKCLSPRKARIVRIRQIGKNHRNMDDIQLSGVEFFGRVFEHTEMIE